MKKYFSLLLFLDILGPSIICYNSYWFVWDVYIFVKVSKILSPNLEIYFHLCSFLTHTDLYVYGFWIYIFCLCKFVVGMLLRNSKINIMIIYFLPNKALFSHIEVNSLDLCVSLCVLWNMIGFTFPFELRNDLMIDYIVI